MQTQANARRCGRFHCGRKNALGSVSINQNRRNGAAFAERILRAAPVRTVKARLRYHSHNTNSCRIVLLFFHSKRVCRGFPIGGRFAVVGTPRSRRAELERAQPTCTIVQSRIFDRNASLFMSSVLEWRPAAGERRTRRMLPRIDFQTEPARYRHWRLKLGGDAAELVMDVDENAGLFDGYKLKLNSYDLGVDIELDDAVQRLRFEHPEVKVVILKSEGPRLLRRRQHSDAGGRPHALQGQLLQVHQRDAQRHRGCKRRIRPEYLCAIRGTAAGGGYELALAADYIMLADDGSSTVSCPSCRCSRSCPAPAGSPASPTSARCGATSRMPSAPPRKASKARARSKWRLVDEVAASPQSSRRPSAARPRGSLHSRTGRTALRA